MASIASRTRQTEQRGAKFIMKGRVLEIIIAHRLALKSATTKKQLKDQFDELGLTDKRVESRIWWKEGDRAERLRNISHPSTTAHGAYRLNNEIWVELEIDKFPHFSVAERERATNNKLENINNAKFRFLDNAPEGSPKVYNTRSKPGKDSEQNAASSAAPTGVKRAASTLGEGQPSPKKTWSGKTYRIPTETDASLGGSDAPTAQHPAHSEMDGGLTIAPAAADTHKCHMCGESPPQLQKTRYISLLADEDRSDAECIRCFTRDLDAEEVIPQDPAVHKPSLIMKVLVRITDRELDAKSELKKSREEVQRLIAKYDELHGIISDGKTHMGPNWISAMGGAALGIGKQLCVTLRADVGCFMTIFTFTHSLVPLMFQEAPQAHSPFLLA
ncbi:uncharacterized protein PAC_00659 [Phialocephala subalpina]|uniref:Uncharacterized protein n=1 Tax=Phialocephala subalpina TaxID=576137 RepID=A0A1L7WDB7_9HELO|nr:uncharacterized protein PAC_00659 [Phialocephala subalpina]